MNVFDFDKTIYRGDSTVHFILFISRRHPSVIGSLIKGLPTVWAYKRGKKSKTEMKQKLFACFSRVADIDGEVKLFWDKHIERVESLYLSLKREDDVIISASPEFLLREACSRLGVENLIASRVDKKSGRYDGENCYGEEKPKRFRQMFPEGRIECFYSDSYSDAPMARLAEKPYIIKGRKASPWEKERL